jgi:hypothetical protein
MRAIAALTTAAISGGTLAIAYVAIEATAAAAGATISDGVRIWAATLIGLTTLGPLGLAILCRQAAIIKQLIINQAILTEILNVLEVDATEAKAGRDFDDIRRRLGGHRGADGITHLYPEE